MSRVILQREIPPEQVVKLLTTGKTDLLDKFISKKGRPFSAYLKLEKTGKVGFEFEPRAARTAKARAQRANGPHPARRANENRAAVLRCLEPSAGIRRPAFGCTTILLGYEQES